MASKSIKNTKNTKRAKTTKKKKPVATRKASKSQSKQRHYSPLSVLTIMGLITVIIVMLNNFHTKKQAHTNDDKISDVTQVTVLTPEQVKPVLPEKKERPNHVPQAPQRVVKKDEPKTVLPASQTGDKTGHTQKKMKLYYLRFNEANEKISYVPVTRKIQTGTQLEDTLKSLIQGLSTSEEKRGYISTLPENLRVRNIHLQHGIVTIDFNQAFAYNAVGDILVSRINQIFLTVSQFSQVKGVVLKVNGRLVDAIDGDGRHFNWPMRRRL